MPFSRLSSTLAWLNAALMAFVCGPLAHAADNIVLVDSIAALRAHLSEDGAKVRLKPGKYRLEQLAPGPNFLEFTGRNSVFDFTGVTFEVDTAEFARFKPVGLNIIMLAGDGIVMDGLSLETIGPHPPPGGCRGISIMGRGVILRNASLRLSGSYPYGYGSYFGIGAGSAINPQKQNGIRIGGIDDQVINCRVVMRCFGHAIFLRGAQNALVKDCTIEGALRKTDEILAEKSGPAFEQGFRQYTGAMIPAGKMTSLSEDGIRAYPNDPETNRRTQDIRVENCRVTRMRRGICLAYAKGRNSVTGCEVTECERVAYHVQSETIVRDCRGDARYSQVLDVSTTHSRGSDIEIAVLDSRGFYGHHVLATVNGHGHRIVLREVSPGFVPSALTVDVAQARSAPGEEPEESGASRVDVANLTPASVVLHPTSKDCVVTSVGAVTDRGAGNAVKRPTAATGAEPELLPKHAAVGSKLTPAHVDWDHPIYRSNFADPGAVADWRLEGGKQMLVRDGKFVLESAPGARTASDNTGHLVCWLTREVPGDFLLEFSIRPLNRQQGLAIVFFNTRGIHGESIFDPALKKRDGTFLQYLRSDLNSYHISYWSGERARSHLRKNYGAYVVAMGDDLIADAPAGTFQTVRIYKRGGAVRLAVDDVVALGYDDDGQTHGPVWNHSGWIGLRQMSHAERCEYGHVSVWPLKGAGNG